MTEYFSRGFGPARNILWGAGKAQALCFLEDGTVRIVDDVLGSTPVDVAILQPNGTLTIPGLVVTGALGWRNVKDYGAVGNGVTNDSAAIAAAIAATPDGGVVYFPTGAYVTSTTIDFSAKIGVTVLGTGHRGGFGAGTQGSLIMGSVAGDLVKYVPSGGCISIRGMSFRNTSTSASAVGVHIESVVGGGLFHCLIGGTGGYGFFGPQNLFGFSIVDTVFGGSISTFPNAIGIYFAGNAFVVSGCDIGGWAEGIRYTNAAMTLNGGRLEVNKIGINVGMDNTGAAGTGGGGIRGPSFEANDTAILLTVPANLTIENVGIQGSVNAPSGQSLYGIRQTGSASQTAVRNSSTAGSFSRAAISIEGAGRIVWSQVSANNVFATNPKTWDVRMGLSGSTYEQSFINTDFTIRPDDAAGAKWNTLQRHLRGAYLSQLDYLTANVEGKNLRHKALAVPASAASLAVTFTGTGHGAGASDINTATATAGAGLADGTYFYRATAVTGHGESASLTEKSVTLGSGNNQTTVAFFGMTTDGFKRRIYRGTASGVYDGYYETALNSNASFVDTGAALDGKRSPPVSGVDDTAMVEPDTAYEVFVTTNWNTTWWITAKATTGYTVNFGTSAPSDGSGLVGAFYVR